MPQVAIGNEQYAGGPSVFDAPKLEPAFKDERARIFIPDPGDLWVEYRHSLGGQRAGVAAFGGNWICTGRADVLNSSNPHADPEACVCCKAHANGDALVSKATRKWVTQIFRYQTDPSGGQLALPFNVRLLVWMFSDREYRAMEEIQRSWGDIRKYDLLLTCSNKDFKNWDVTIQPQALWATQPEWVTVVQESYRQQHINGSDIELIIGRRPSNEAEVLQKLAELRAPAGFTPAMGSPFPGMPGQPQPGAGYFPGMPAPNGTAPFPPALSQPETAPPPFVGGPGLVPAASAIPISPVPPAPPVMAAPPAVAPMAPPPAFPPQMPAPGPSPMVPPPAPEQPVPAMAAPPAMTAPAAPVMPPPVAQPAPPAAAGPPTVDFGSLLQVPPAPPAPASA